MTDFCSFLMANDFNSSLDSYHSCHGHSENFSAKVPLMSKKNKNKEKKEKRLLLYMTNKAQKRDTVSFQHR